MVRVTVVLATCAALPGLAPDDRLLIPALRRRGVAAEPAVWEDPHYEWSSAALCVIRSAWDYAYRPAAFQDWMRRVAAAVPVWNPPGVVEWNMHKRYLVDLADRGVPTVPTLVLPAGPPTRLAEVLERQGWDDVILKAAVAQTGRYLMRVTPDRRAEGQRHLDRLQPYEDMLIQPFVPGAVESGETSVVFVDGAVSHAVRKQAAAEELRVHDDFGGTIEPISPAADELETARSAVAAAAAPLLYARVDLVRGPTGPMVMELELVEPELYLRYADRAADRMANAILTNIQHPVPFQTEGISGADG